MNNLFEKFRCVETFDCINNMISWACDWVRKYNNTVCIFCININVFVVGSYKISLRELASLLLRIV